MFLKDKRKNILFLSSWFPSKSHSTLGNFVQRHAEAVARLNNVHVLYITYAKGQKECFRIEDFEECGVKITIVYCRPTKILKFRRKWNGFLRGLRHIEKNIQFRYELVHHNVIWKDGWQPLFINISRKIPYIITEHWTGFDSSSRKDTPALLRPLARLFASRASVLSPVTENLAQNMAAFGIKGIYRVVPNIVNIELFHLGERPNDKVRFLHVSSLNNDQKNITGILHAWKQASEQNPNIHLTIGGDGPWHDYKTLSEEMGISTDQITFFGEKRWSEIADLMESNHCLLMFSNYENLPCVIVEALATGMFVISTRVGGIAEHINEERGILIEKNSEKALVTAILWFSIHSNLVDKSALRKYAVEHFSQQVIAAAFDEIYREVLKV